MRSRLFLTVSEGETAKDARPLVVTSDPDAIAAVAHALARRLGAELPRVLRTTEKPKEGGA